MKIPEKILKCNEVLLETKVKIIYTMVFPLFCTDVEAGQLRNLTGKNRLIWNVVLEESLVDTEVHYKDKTVDSISNQTTLVSRSKND